MQDFTDINRRAVAIRSISVHVLGAAEEAVHTKEVSSVASSILDKILSWGVTANLWSVQNGTTPAVPDVFPRAALSLAQWQDLSRSVSPLIPAFRSGTQIDDGLVNVLSTLFDMGVLAYVPARPEDPTPPKAPEPTPYGWDCGGVLVRSALVMEVYSKEGVECTPLHGAAPKAGPKVSPETLDTLKSGLRGSFQVVHAMAQFVAEANEGVVPFDAAPDFLHDLISHRRNWRTAIERLRDSYPDLPGHYDRGYWDRELNVFDRTVRELMAFLGGQV